MWPFKSKNKAEKQNKNIRIDIEDLSEQGFTCSEIAEELGVTQEEVYRVKQAKGRRDARMSGRNPESEDRISKLKEELAAVELQDKIDEAKHKSFIREEERREYLEENIEEVGEAAENPDKLLNVLMLSAMQRLQGPQANNLNTPSPNPAPFPNQSGEVLGNSTQQTESKPPFPSPEIDFSKIEFGIKTGLITEERFKAETEALKLKPEKAQKLFKFIKEKL